MVIFKLAKLDVKNLSPYQRTKLSNGFYKFFWSFDKKFYLNKNKNHWQIQFLFDVSYLKLQKFDK